MAFRLSSLLPTRKTPSTLALLYEDNEISWLLYDQDSSKIHDQGVSDWSGILRNFAQERIQGVRVLVTGRGIHYGYCSSSQNWEEQLEAQIPYLKGQYQLRTIDVPCLEQPGERARFFAAADNSLISRISRDLGNAGMKLSSLEVPATALARRSSSLETSSETLLQVHIGRVYTQYLVNHRGYPYLAREITMGYKELVAQYSTHLQCPAERAGKELETHSVLGSGPIEPAVVQILEQAARTMQQFRYPMESVSVLGPGWLRGLETRLAGQCGASPLFGDNQARSPASILLEVMEQ